MYVIVVYDIEVKRVQKVSKCLTQMVELGAKLSLRGRSHARHFAPDQRRTRANHRPAPG